MNQRQIQRALYDWVYWATGGTIAIAWEGQAIPEPLASEPYLRLKMAGWTRESGRDSRWLPANTSEGALAVSRGTRSFRLTATAYRLPEQDDSQATTTQDILKKLADSIDDLFCWGYFHKRQSMTIAIDELVADTDYSMSILGNTFIVNSGQESVSVLRDTMVGAINAADFLSVFASACEEDSDLILEDRPGVEFLVSVGERMSVETAQEAVGLGVTGISEILDISETVGEDFIDKSVLEFIFSASDTHYRTVDVLESVAGSIDGKSVEVE